MNSSYLAILTSFVLSAALVAEPAAELFKKLNADSYAERHKAQLGLAAWAVENPEVAIELFLKKYIRTKQPELRERVFGLLKEIVLFEEFGNRGFMGIQMSRIPEKVGKELFPAVRVMLVGVGTPADVFGLKRGDLIWAIDDVPFNRRQAVQDQFQLIISSKRIGDMVDLKILRGDDQLKIKLKLGAAAVEIKKMNLPELRPRGTELEKEKEKENYFNNWLQSKMEAEGEKPKLESAVK